MAIAAIAANCFGEVAQEVRAESSCFLTPEATDYSKARVAKLVLLTVVGHCCCCCQVQAAASLRLNSFQRSSWWVGRWRLHYLSD